MRKKFCCFCGAPRPRDWMKAGWIGCQVNSARWHFRCNADACKTRDVMKHAALATNGEEGCKENHSGVLCTRLEEKSNG
jgi:hypothetical protein